MMANMLVLVLDQVEKFPEIVRAWEEVGVPGVTVLDSAGSRKLLDRASRDDVPLIPSLRSLLEGEESHNRTMFTVLEDDVVLERAIEAARKIVGDFDVPHTGILFVVPVTRTFGVPKAKRKAKAHS
jgi:nitrogen regulatory protein P-II 1